MGKIKGHVPGVEKDFEVLVALNTDGICIIDHLREVGTQKGIRTDFLIYNDTHCSIIYTCILREILVFTSFSLCLSQPYVLKYMKQRLPMHMERFRSYQISIEGQCHCYSGHCLGLLVCLYRSLCWLCLMRSCPGHCTLTRRMRTEWLPCYCSSWSPLRRESK